MPWVEATLRGERVFARTRADGALDAPGGRVEVVYRLDAPKSYRASLGNLVVAKGATVHPDAARAAQGGRPPARASGEDAARSVHGTTDWIAYTDGACSGNPGPAGAGMVVI